MPAALKEYGVQVVALSTDTVAQATVHKNRDGLNLTLLADPNLKIIRQYGVEHQKALGFKTTSLVILETPIPPIMSFQAMAIPTSLLIDEHGVIQWVDQAEDYRIRSKGERVLEAVKNAFGAAES